ncbi:MAG: methylmalonyl Co-A mutase-associated GTPase MeaB [Saprospiraceae bacterium]|nr:methylmalonyl Co-A mutase-associated GTPase MeaB [Saprospiraceae bacterium]
MNSEEIEELYSRINRGDRFALSKAITLVESRNAADQLAALELISLTRNEKRRSHTLAISGAPGVGKSSFIEELGLAFINQKQEVKVAVLAVDPSSVESHGSILGDKTRMPQLSKSRNAYVRPSPNAGVMGGVGLATYEISELCRVAGYNLILIETVGAGQSDIEAKYFADFLIVLLQPGAGDDLQGIKRGLIELADLLIVTKHDGALKEAAERTQQAYQASDANGSARKTVLCSAEDKTGFEDVLVEIKRLLESTGQRSSQVDREQYRFMARLKSLAQVSFIDQHKLLIDSLRNEIGMGKLDYLQALQRVVNELKILQ